MPTEAVGQAALEAAHGWYESKRAKKTGHVSFNVMAVGLAVANFVRTCELPLKQEDISAKNGAQVKGLNAAFIRRRLDDRGIKGKIPVESGRTSRGSVTKAFELAQMLNAALVPFDPGYIDRAYASEALEDYFVTIMVDDYFNKQCIDVAIDVNKPVSAIVKDIIDAAQQRSDKPAGTVVQHLVGAKLELRFPEANVGRDRAHAADQQTKRQGDFELGTTAFHVTMSPMTKLIERVRENLQQGYRPVVLVPESEVDFARGLFRSEADLANRVGVQSIETFVGTNVEEMADFDIKSMRRLVALLIRTYNERIQEIETDMSLRIMEPQWFDATLNS